MLPNLRRLRKHLFYGLFYFAFFGSIIYGTYFLFLKPIPSCFDHVKNGNETGVDCGGTCIDCAIRSLSPIGVTFTRLFFTDTPQALIKLRNPNANYGAAALPYTLAVTDAGGNEVQTIEGKTFIYPGETDKYFINDLRLGLAGTALSAKVTLGAPLWQRSDQFSKPEFIFRQGQRTDENGKIIVSGNIKNNETLPFHSVIVGALFYGTNGALIGASRTEVFDVTAFEERYFQIDYPSLSDVDLDKTQLFYEAKR